jgi:hypothetical protein
MPYDRAPVAVIYFCALLTAGLILALMAYMGLFDGALDVLVTGLKDIAKFFSQ